MRETATLDPAYLALGTVILGALLGGVIQTVNAWIDRKREGRAAALVVFSTLSEAGMATYAPQGKPFSPVFIDFDAYTAVWADERKALARTLPPTDYSKVSKAFEELRTLRRREARADDLGDTVFDRMLDASQACEFGRRIAWAHAQPPRARVARWLDLKREALRVRRGHIIVVAAVPQGAARERQAPLETTRPATRAGRRVLRPKPRTLDTALHDNDAIRGFKLPDRGGHSRGR